MKYSVGNMAGGNCRNFQANHLTETALRHAVACSACGGPVFGGPDAEMARGLYEEIYEQYLAGECSEKVERIFEG